MKVFWTLQAYNGDDSFLSPLERKRLAEMRFPKRRSEWLMGRWAAKVLLQRTVSQAASLAMGDISILNSPAGAPYAMLKDELFQGILSISHGHGFAFCACGMGKEISLGIDLEKIERRPPVFIEDYFPEQESAYARALPPEEQDRWVTLAWSSREAILKALGIGLRADTRLFEVATRELDDVPGWKLFDIRSDLMTAHAAEHGGSWQVWWDRLDELILTVAVCCDEAVSLIRV